MCSLVGSFRANFHGGFLVGLRRLLLLWYISMHALPFQRFRGHARCQNGPNRVQNGLKTLTEGTPKWSRAILGKPPSSTDFGRGFWSACARQSTRKRGQTGTRWAKTTSGDAFRPSGGSGAPQSEGGRVQGYGRRRAAGRRTLTGPRWDTCHPSTRARQTNHTAERQSTHLPEWPRTRPPDPARAGPRVDGHRFWCFWAVLGPFWARDGAGQTRPIRPPRLPPRAENGHFGAKRGPEDGFWGSQDRPQREL